MRLLLLRLVMLVGIHKSGLAQCDPGFGSNPSYTKTSASGKDEIHSQGQLTFDFGVGNVDGCNTQTGNQPGSIIISVSFGDNYYPSSEKVLVKGTHADIYDWIWDKNSKTMIGTNVFPVPPGPPAQFTVDVKSQN